VAATFEVFRYEVRRDGAAPETRYSLVPMKGVRTAGRDEPQGAVPQENGSGVTSEHESAGEVQVPDGSTIVTTDPPVLDIPGQGRVDLHAIIGATGGNAEGAAHLVRWRPR
jgi:hypothetical protein